MVNEYYTYLAKDDHREFLFYSEGKQGRILKAIIFHEIGKDRWNLGFGDVIDGKIHDKIVSNNNDIMKVLGTVAKATKEFVVYHHEVTVFIKPVDERRQMLYNRIFRNHYDEIDTFFEIKGYENEDDQIGEFYQTAFNYHHFSIKLKF
jgi:hypothetical protein